jgi:two-component system, OmpR family, phosphate regulon response regulator PhoB
MREPPPRPDRVLVVEDEHDIAAPVAFHLARAGYRVRTVADGTGALDAVAVELPDLIVLDLMLPGVSGLAVLRQLRGRDATALIPVILLTALPEERGRIEGLQLGADDYVVKPFSPQELVLRVGAVLRRSGQPPPGGGSGNRPGIGPVVVDTGARRATVDGRTLDLTPTEYRLLAVLVERRGRIQTRRQLLEAVWDTTADITTRTVDMHVKRLRGKLGTAAPWLETARGLGYRFRSEPPGA